ncbi:MAG: ATP-binding protein [Flavobacteriaceae bacterium]|mgnify:FL=1|jgi:MoxR-like ATPase|tara:strand:- start:1001 stop:2131 length:1131 start_codon:yes stop_codon:yes gene_type:complete
MSIEFIEFGKKGSSREIKVILSHIFERNNDLNKEDKRGTAVCIWGTHGLGKTQIVRDYALEKKWKFSYIAPAQFEEMGDLHGMPTVVDPDKRITGDEYTVYSPPDWVPREEGPGILLLDDINRADDRILRGCMQLLQNFELTSWKLPPKWQIVATANPEGGDYSVTPMDGAMLTRMLHATLKFDAKIWAEWAYAANVDERGIAFVLTYPELVNSDRTTPRSLTQFFEQIASIENLKDNLQLVQALALSSLDEVTVSSFIAFVNDELTQLIDPEEILDAEDFKSLEKRIKDISVDESGAKRVDRLATMCSRLYLKLASDDYKQGKNHSKNLIKFLMFETIPNDLLMSLYMDLQKHGSDEIKEMTRDKKLANKLLSTL